MKDKKGKLLKIELQGASVAAVSHCGMRSVVRCGNKSPLIIRLSPPSAFKNSSLFSHYFTSFFSNFPYSFFFFSIFFPFSSSLPSSSFFHIISVFLHPRKSTKTMIMATLKLSEITNDRSNNWVRGQAVTSWKTILWNGNLHEIVSPPLLHQNFFSSSLTTFHLSLLLPHNLTPLYTLPPLPPIFFHSLPASHHPSLLRRLLGFLLLSSVTTQRGLRAVHWMASK